MNVKDMIPDFAELTSAMHKKVRGNTSEESYEFILTTLKQQQMIK